MSTSSEPPSEPRTETSAPDDQASIPRSGGAGWTDIVAVLLVIAVAAVGYFVTQGGASGPAAPSVPLTPGAARRLMAARPRVTTPARLDFVGLPPGEVVLKEGAAVPLVFSVDAPSRPLVLEERSTHEVVLLFPPPGEPSVTLPASSEITIEDPVGGTYVVREPAGPRRVRLIVFPPEVDPFAIQPTELARLIPHLTILEKHYVAAPRE